MTRIDIDRSEDRRIRSHLSAFDRIKAGVIIDPVTGCWNWQGVTSVGYGRIKYLGKLELTHRVAYRLWVGELIPGMHIDHLCFNTLCCNPEHLEQVTPMVNWHRSSPPLSHCGRGHEFSDANTYVSPKGRRDCRTCKLERQRVWRQLERAA